jgi:Mrp family chromosome partitioning ATPase
MSRNFELLKQLEIEVDVTEDRAQIVDERPRVVDERPRVADERPRVVDERPRVADERPRVADERPRVADERPRVADERPRIGDERARAVDERVIAQELSPKNLGDAQGEEMLSLAQTIVLSATGRTARQVVFCGVDEDNGSSSVCASAGRALAAIGAKSVCLVDANVRSPRLSRALGINTPSLVPGRSGSIREQCVFIDSSLWLAGTDLMIDSRGALLPVADLKHRLQELQEAFEYVLIDAPAAGILPDAAILGQLADAAVLVVEANSTRRVTARRAKDTLEAAGVRLLGSVLRNRSFPLPKGLYKKV